MQAPPCIPDADDTSPTPGAQRRALLAGFGGLAAGVVLTRPANAGPLNPPAGPVVSTGKTLTEVEPRIAINSTNTRGDADSVYKISLPGPYYITGNVQGVAGKQRIKVAASGICVDLNGFDLVGVPDSLSGVTIELNSSHRNTTVRNGSVRDWGSSGVDVFSNNSLGSLIEQVHAASNGLTGIRTGPNGVIRDCTASANLGDGILVGQNSVAEGCSARQNSARGIVTGLGAIVRGCCARENGIHGFQVQIGGRASECAAFLNGGDGFSVSSGTVERSEARANSGNGIAAASSCVLRQNLCRNNGRNAADAAGILVTGSDCLVEGNTLLAKDRGLDVDAAGNFITRNACSGNTANWSVVTGNVILVVNAATAGAVSGNSGGVSPGSTDPTAKFTF